MNVPEFHEVPNLTAQAGAVSVFNQVSLATMAKAQTKDSALGLVIPYMHGGSKRVWSFLKLDAKQYVCTCFNLTI